MEKGEILHVTGDKSAFIFVYSYRFMPPYEDITKQD